ncbi:MULTISPECIES: hypothetical protein [Sphingobium]|uniref:Uncharacterized protein n=1 Tax=Sphingobium yanoikuyae TaxID=13690 RepID=A0A9X7U9X4_SPHYA|nr:MULTISPECIES: hypothetical protein [Sphingobium]QNG45434.1 hypothetical protein H3V42_27160 [Sphingobium yanoikuyae]
MTMGIITIIEGGVEQSANDQKQTVPVSSQTSLEGIIGPSAISSTLAILRTPNMLMQSGGDDI